VRFLGLLATTEEWDRSDWAPSRAAKLDIWGRNAVETNWGYITEFLAVHDARQMKHSPREFRRVVEMFCKHASDMDGVRFFYRLEPSSC